MKVYIMRHGEAVYSASSDSVRKLTEHGKAQCDAVGKYFLEQGISFDLALVSPYLRAQESFSVVANCVSVKRAETETQLVPGGNPEYIVDYLTLLASTMGVQSVFIVSHLPLVGYLVNGLCPEVSPPMLSTADVVCISLSKEGKGTIEWYHH